MEKTRIPFFSKSYFREMLREFTTVGIVFAAIEFAASLIAFLGAPLDLYSLFAYSMEIYVQPSAVSCIGYFCFFAGLIFALRHLSRTSWDFRGGIPFAKRTMLVSAFFALLAWIVVCIAANILGALFGILFSSASGTALIYPNVAMVAEKIGCSLLSGLTACGALVVIFSLTSRTTVIIAAGFTCAFLPKLVCKTIENNSNSNISLSQLLFPVSPEVSALLGWLFRILLCVAALIAAYFAYVNAQAETSGKPARAAWVHVLIGLGFSAIWALIFMGDILPFGSAEAFLRYQWTLLIPPAIAGFIAYFAFNWITMRSFKAASKRLMFYPVLLSGLALTLLFAKAATRAAEKIEIRANNIDYVTVQGGLVPYDSLTSDCWRGNQDSEKIKLRDEKLFAFCEKYATGNYNNDFVLFGPTGVSFARDYVLGCVTLAVKLNNGKTYTFFTSLESTLDVTPGYTASLKDILLSNSEYAESNINLSRFKNGKVVIPRGLDSDFYNTLMRELEALDSDELLEQFRITERIPMVSDALDTWNYETFTGSDFGLNTVVLSDAGGYYCRPVRINEKTPESLNMLIAYYNRRTEKSLDFKTGIEMLQSERYNVVIGTVSDVDHNPYSNFVYFDVDGMAPPTLHMQAYMNRDAIETLLRFIEQSCGKTPEQGQHVMYVNFQTIASGEYSEDSILKDYEGDVSDYYIYLDDWLLSDFGVEYTEQCSLSYYIILDDAEYQTLLSLFPNTQEIPKTTENGNGQSSIADI